MTESTPPDPPPSPLETELAAYRPVVPSARVTAAIAAHLASVPSSAAPSSAVPNSAPPRITAPHAPASYSFADRLLLSTLTAGLAAACVIITLLTLDFAGSRAAIPPSNLIRATLSSTADDPSRLLAQLMADRTFPFSDTPQDQSATLPN